MAARIRGCASAKGAMIPLKLRCERIQSKKMDSAIELAGELDGDSRRNAGGAIAAINQPRLSVADASF